ncbi:MAG TPA: protein kinase [Gammaproteobacteria bacterium]|nr:protein kinase [Gammaproteobacteria bacterium]
MTDGTDATRIKPAAADATRIEPAAGDATRLKPGTADSTAVKPAAPPERVAAAERSAPLEATRLKARPTGGPASTGSDWSHPEEWESRGDAVLGPGSVVKQRFALESVLGRGGMGVVYRALDRRKQEAQDREPYVAIKILGEEFRRHPNALIALQREARKAQALAHPNVITVHDFDRDGTTVYMTMELLDGEPLNKVIAAHADRGLPPEKALAIVHSAAEALAYAHKKGIVHSDFKPGNVFLTRRGEVKVLDFGIARAVPTQLAPDADDTVFDAAALGALTPSYASLEMLRGEPPAPADDVYALAVVAYELLTGRHPFDRLPADRARVEGLAPPAVAELPRRQRKALARALSFERAARQPDAGAFLRELEGPSPVRKAAYASALVLLAGIAAYAFYSGSQLKPDVPFSDLPPQAQQQFNEDVEQGEKALGFGDFALNDAFDYFSRAYDIHRNNPRAVDGLERVADRFLKSMASADRETQRNVLRKLYCQEYLSGYAPVDKACESALGARQCTFEGMGCPSRDTGP